VGRTVVLRLRFGDFTQATRSRTLEQATASTSPVLETARELLADAWPTISERGLTKVGIAVTGLHSDDTLQLALPFTKHDRVRLDAAVDQIRDRYGVTSLVRTSLVGREPIEMPRLPD
jgi:DNA polymerase-4